MDDLDLDLDLDRGAGRLFGTAFRLLRWLVWDFACEWLAWIVGWGCCRLLSVGRFPSVGLGQVDQAGWWEELAVIVVGWVAILGAVWGLLKALGG
jgi:hypothetical protein